MEWVTWLDIACIHLQLNLFLPLDLLRICRRRFRKAFLGEYDDRLLYQDLDKYDSSIQNDLYMTHTCDKCGIIGSWYQLCKFFYFCLIKSVGIINQSLDYQITKLEHFRFCQFSYNIYLLLYYLYMPLPNELSCVFGIPFPIIINLFFSGGIFIFKILKLLSIPSFKCFTYFVQPVKYSAIV